MTVAPSLAGWCLASGHGLSLALDERVNRPGSRLKLAARQVVVLRHDALPS